jgi:hypothetical protein
MFLSSRPVIRGVVLTLFYFFVVVAIFVLWQGSGLFLYERF